jgi:hypothetical protein
LGGFGREVRRLEEMKKNIISLISIIVLTWTIAYAAPKDLEIKEKQLISQKPPFTFTLPSELSMIYSFSHENPAENSLTRAYFLVKVKGKQVEEMLILQIADKTNPQAGPMTVPSLKPYTEKRMYSKSKVKKKGLEINYILQLMAWNPDAPSLQPIVKKGIVIPFHWALQGQFLFTYQGEHAVLGRYSRDVHSFGVKISEEGKDWERSSVSGNEMKTYEAFQKIFIGMINSIDIKNL